MKSYKFLFTNGLELNFRVLTLSRKDSFSATLLKLLYILGISLLFIFALILPLSGLILSNITYESNIFYFSLFCVVVSYSIILARLFLTGKKVLTDTPNLLTILIFALLTTLAAVFATPASINNTFGTHAVRSVSGLFVMLMIGLYYLINIYIVDKSAMRKFLKFIFAGYLVMYLYVLFSSYTTPDLFGINLYNIFPIFIIAAFALLSRRRLNWIPVVLFVILIAVSHLLFQTGLVQNLNKLLYSLISAIIAFSIILIFILVNNKKFIAEKIVEIKENILDFKNNSKQVNALVKLGFLLAPVILLLIFLLIVMSYKIDMNSLLAKNNDIGTSFGNLINSGRSDPQLYLKIFAGLGGRVLNPSFSLISNIISTQGLLGILAYLFLGVSATYTSFKLLKDSLNNRDYKIQLFLSFTIIFVPILSFFTYPGILTVILWWIAFSLVSISLKIKNKEELPIELDVERSGRFFRGVIKKYITLVDILVVASLLIIGFMVIIGLNRLGV